MNALRPQTNTELATGVRAVAGTMMMLAAAFLAGVLLVPIYPLWIVGALGVLILIWRSADLGVHAFDGLLLRSRVLAGKGILRPTMVLLVAWLAYSTVLSTFVSLGPLERARGTAYGIPPTLAAILLALVTLVLLLPAATAVGMLFAARSVSDRRWVGLAGAAILLMAVHLRWHPFWDPSHETYSTFHLLVALFAVHASVAALGGTGMRLMQRGAELRVAGAVSFAGLILGFFAARAPHGSLVWAFDLIFNPS